MGRNLARTFLQYYRFINFLPIPIVPEIREKHRKRPRTHKSRSRSKTRYEVKPQPTTTRPYAPISYTNLSICHDSGGSSDEGGFSPTRYILGSSFSGHRNNRLRAVGTSGTLNHPIHPYDQFAQLAIRSAKCNRLEKQKTTSSINHISRRVDDAPIQDIIVNIPPKPYLSIIDLNQLTRGSFSKKSKSFDK